MNKKEFLEETYNSAFEDEFNKLAGEVKIPEGGLRPGLFNDLTQVMTPEDAKRVKEKKNVFMRSGPGPDLLTGSLVGAFTGGNIQNFYDMLKGRESKSFKYLKSKPALIGAATLPALMYSLSRFGVYDKQALKAAKKLVEETKD